MKQEDYVETLDVKGKKVDVGLDDYGQCYYFEFEDDNGDIKEVSCRTFNGDYVGEIADYFNVNEEDIFPFTNKAYPDEKYKEVKEKYESLIEERDNNFLNLKKAELDLALAEMIKNEKYVGKVFRNGNKVYKVIGCFGCKFYELFCLVLDFDQELYSVYRDTLPQSYGYTYITLEEYDPVRVERVDIESLGEEITNRNYFEEKLIEIINKVNEEANALHQRTKNMYKKELSNM